MNASTDPQSYAELRKRVESEPLFKNLGELIDFSVACYSDKPAWISIDSDGRSLTYDEIGKLIAKSANSFASMGVKKGSHVALMMPSAPEHLCAWVALAKIGAVSIGINPNYTTKELGYTLVDSKAEYLLTASKFLPNLETLLQNDCIAAQKVAVWGSVTRPFHDWAAALDSADWEFKSDEVEVAGADPINILYTSGSTGFPKGCVLPHDYWVIKGKIVANLWPETTRILCDAPFHYMGPLWRFAFACYLGAAIYVAPRASLTRFVARWKEHKIDFGWINNAMAMTNAQESDSDNSLEVLGTSGISPTLQDAVEKRFGAKVREHYGMTEIGLAIVMPIDADEMLGSGSCGLEAPFRECMIADENGETVRCGEVGELCVRGLGIVKEYIGKPEANAQAFRGGWFRTGDLFWQDENGYFYFNSRIKDIIRRSAENISATEVETALSTIGEVQEVAVGPVKDAMRGEEVKAFIILKPGHSSDSVNPEKIIEYCSQLLARYKLPRYFQYYSEFPKTSSNKIAKKLLLNGEGSAVTRTYDITSGTWD
ncbi:MULTISPECIES: class I adenylate-forming enzyme family protein [Paraburkholderia]|jgi:Acyl-CoA synthetases (AMP-forming)/AMP-acid ligases II|uniref:class I adenylate-forming enzyme family protein n=1 Tax=Paraburkholderia TaxID=1822464 RepID=UPI00190AA98B|nr:MULTISPECIES: class I adenylate-forming enzyme family protein [Paraburkholderia]MBK3744982.1 acyl--CoA ligase [Paraburkholderia aspalathi]MBK5185863.1 acyl--CoA ligase [Burkholderia sp. R-69749]CAE6854352.1 Crotonobetaine/carnitine--CoA ligase [Paraburkholderia nemoris]CAE6896489.1 Crotonobetaine/carnitine--CoA ligase [Paraburkholderia domus]